MAEVNLRSWPEISQAYEGLQWNSTAATWENILARLARLETRLVEHERRVAATHSPLRPEPDPPDKPWLYTAAQPPHAPYQPMPESYHCYPSPTAAVVWQPPQLREPSSWFNMPQHQVLSSTPTYIASAISPTATTQSRSYHGQPIAVLQPLLSPPSHCRSAATLPAAAPPPPLPRYTVMGKAYGDQLPVNGSPEINADGSQSNAVDSDGDQIEPSENDGKVHTIQTLTNLAAKKPLHSIEETRLGKGAPKNASEEEFYDVEKDPPKDLQEKVVWLKVEQYMLIEEKRSAELRAEELEIAPMQQELYGLRSALVEKYEHENARTRIQHSLPSVNFYGNNEGGRSTIRCAFDPGGVSSPKFLFVALFIASWFPP